MAFNVNKCKLLRITYLKSSVIMYVYNMYQANALSYNNSPLLALLAKKHLGFTVPTTDFIHIGETQHESYLGVMIDNELNFNQHIDGTSKKATNLLNLCRRNLHMCSRKVKNSAYNMIVRPHLEYASTCWSPYTKRIKKWKCVIFKCYSTEELITLNTLHEVVPTWYSFHSWVDWSNADKVSCSRRKHIDAEVRTRNLCIQNRHSNHNTNCSR